MPMTPGLKPNIFSLPPEQPDLSGNDVQVVIDEGSDKKHKDDSGKILRIEHPDGSVTISLDGKSLGEDEERPDYADWFRNMVDEIDDGAIGLVVDSYGMLAVCKRQDSAARDLGIGSGDQVTLRAATDGPVGLTTRVEITHGHKPV